MKNNKQLKKGVFLVIEGIDGAGKSTQVKLLKERLLNEGYDVVATKEPTEDSPYGRKIRESMYSEKKLALQEELELFIKDREEHLKNFILPSLSEKKVVICDRYYYSNIAYQGAQGLDTQEIKRANEKFAKQPDAVLYLKINVGDGLHRIKTGRDAKFSCFEKEGFLKKVSAIFDAMNYSYFHVVDATKGKEDVQLEISKIVKGILSAHE